VETVETRRAKQLVYTYVQLETTDAYDHEWELEDQQDRIHNLMAVREMVGDDFDQPRYAVT
jgi:hypothetical protein